MQPRATEEKKPTLANLPSVIFRNKILTFLPGTGKNSLAFFTRTNRRTAYDINDPTSITWKELIKNELLIPTDQTFKLATETFKEAYHRHHIEIQKHSKSISQSINVLSLDLPKLKQQLADIAPIYQPAVTTRVIIDCFEAINSHFTYNNLTRINRHINEFHTYFGDDFINTVLRDPSLTFFYLFNSNSECFRYYLLLLNKEQRHQLIMSCFQDGERFHILLKKIAVFPVLLTEFTEDEKAALLKTIIEYYPRYLACFITAHRSFWPLMFDTFNTPDQRNQLRNALKNGYSAEIFIQTIPDLKIFCAQFPEAEAELFNRILNDGEWLGRLIKQADSITTFLSAFPQYKEDIYQAIIKHWNTVINYKILEELFKEYPHKQKEILELLESPTKFINNCYYETKEWLEVLRGNGFKIGHYHREAIIRFHFDALKTEPMKLWYAFLQFIPIFTTPKELELIRNAILNVNMLTCVNRNIFTYFARLYGPPSFPIEHKQKITQFLHQHSAILFKDINDLIDFIKAIRYECAALGMKETNLIKTLLQNPETYSQLFGEGVSQHFYFLRQYPEHMQTLLEITLNDKNRYNNPNFIQHLESLLEACKDIRRYPTAEQIILPTLIADKTFWITLFTKEFNPAYSLRSFYYRLSGPGKEEVVKQIPQIMKNIADDVDIATVLTEDTQKFLTLIENLKKEITYFFKAPIHPIIEILLTGKCGILILKRLIHFESDLLALYKTLPDENKPLLMKIFLQTPELYNRLISSTDGFISLTKMLPEYRDALFDLLKHDEHLQQLVNMEELGLTNSFRRPTVFHCS
ncbi:MAG: hypothetical protein ACYCQI_09210 [Gammaproteobacteria bacterium]